MDKESIREALAVMADEAPAPDRIRARLTMRQPSRSRHGLVAAAATLVLAVVVTTAAVIGRYSPAEPQGITPQTAQQILLTAAERTLHASVGAGRYRISEVERGQLQQVGPAANRYMIMGRTTRESWTAMIAGQDSYVAIQWQGASPATGADKQAWQADGSPATWPVGLPDTPECQPILPAQSEQITSFSGPVSAFREPAERYLPRLAGQTMSVQDLQALPTDPAALRAFLVQANDRSHGPSGTSSDEQWHTERLFSDAVNLLLELPVSAQVRSATYRMLAELPGITRLGSVTDPKGRNGIALAFIEPNGAGSADKGGPEEKRLIIDPATGQLLAVEYRRPQPADYLSWVPAGALFSYAALLRYSLTDDTPPTAPTAGPRPVRVC